MGSLNPDAESKQELDDSGYVQDEMAKPAAETPAKTLAKTEYKGTAKLLDLSDDVLLCILQHLSPQDLKALGFSCARLGSLVLDHTLWVDVDAGGAPLGRRRVRWLLSRALGPHTKRLRLRGYAEEAAGCLGYVKSDEFSDANEDDPTASSSSHPEEERYLCGGPRVYKLTQTTPNRFRSGAPLSLAPETCCGPRLTLTHTALRELSSMCVGLTTLELDYCVIDCHTTNIGMFPKTLLKLSLKGTKCFNLESRSFLFKIQDHLSLLEELDVSNCSWIEPACMLPLSKMPSLHTLSMRECFKLAEFVAYASLATRYGFKKLMKLDLRGSPVGDSEVSALGWLPTLTELLLSPTVHIPRITEHEHYSQDLLPAHNELEAWEEREPDYFNPPPISEVEWVRDEDDVLGNRSCYYSTNCDDPTANRIAVQELGWLEQRSRRGNRCRYVPVRTDGPCILLERMVAEPVAPEEYSQVYHQFLAGHNNNVPIANPEEYRETYRQFMYRPTRGHPPTGYSLFVRNPEPRNEPGPSKRRRTDQPGPSSDNDPQPSTSAVQPAGAWFDLSAGSFDRLSNASNASGAPPTCTNSAHKSSSSDRPSCSSTAPPSDSTDKRPSTSQPSTSKPPDSSGPSGSKPPDSSGPSGSKPPNSSGPSGSKRPLDEPANNRDSDSSSDDDFSPPLKRANKNAVRTNKVPQNPRGQSRRRSERTERPPRRVFEITFNEFNARINAVGDASDAIRESIRQARATAEAALRNPENAPPASASAEDNRLGAAHARVMGNPYGRAVLNAVMNRLRLPETASDAELCQAAAEAAVDVVNVICPMNDAERAERPEPEQPVRPEQPEQPDQPDQPAGEFQQARVRPLERDDDRATRDAAAIIASALTAGDAMNANQLEALQAAGQQAVGQRVEENASIVRQRLFQYRQYRRPIIIEEFLNVPEIAGSMPRGVLFPGCPTRLDPTALVSDASVRRFGRAIGENVNYIHIGGGGGGDVTARPDRSSLIVLAVTGYRHVTDASLLHLATAAPLLQRLDVSNTAVTLNAVERFRALRPDVEITAEHLNII